MSLFEKARTPYFRLGLSKERILKQGNQVQVFTWRGDWVNDALALMLRGKGLCVANEGVAGVILNEEVHKVRSALCEIANSQTPSPRQRSAKAKNIQREKWDWLLPADLLSKTFASNELDIDGAKQITQELCGH